jgi:hypothetical protein
MAEKIPGFFAENQKKTPKTFTSRANIYRHSFFSSAEHSRRRSSRLILSSVRARPKDENSSKTGKNRAFSGIGL